MNGIPLLKRIQSPLPTLLGLASLIVAAVGQYLLTTSRDDRGWFAYLAAAALLVAAVVSAPTDVPMGTPSTPRLSRRALLVGILIGGQVGAVLLARGQHSLWPTGILWLASLAAGVLLFLPNVRLPATWATALVWSWLASLQQRLANSSRTLTMLGVTALTLLGAGLRLVNLESIPSGIHGDEGEFGMVARAVVQGQGPSPFGVAFLDSSALFGYLLAPFVALFGPTMTAIRLPSALAGAVLVPLVYLFVDRLFGVRPALIATYFVATSAALIHFSRLGLDVIYVAPLACASLLLLWYGLTKRHTVAYLASGILGGLAFYVHFSGRLIAPTLVAVILWQLCRRPHEWRAWMHAAVVTGLGGVLALSPMLSHLSSTPERLTAHVSGRMLWTHWDRAAELYATSTGNVVTILGGQFLRVMAGFTRLPDADDFYPFGVPIVPGIVAPLIILGVILLMLRLRDLRYAIVLLWFLVPFVLGNVLVVGPGSTHRMLVCLPPALIAAALLVDYLMRAARRTLPSSAGMLVGAALSIVVVLGGLAGVSFYFGDALRAYPWTPSTAQARFLQSLPAGAVAYVAGAPHLDSNHGTTRFLSGHVERHTIRNLATDVPLETGDHTTGFAFQPHLASWADVVRDYYPDADVRQVETLPGRVVLLTQTVPPGTAARTPDGGLYGELRPLGSTAPSHAQVHPVIAFRGLHVLAEANEFSGRWEGSLDVPQTGDYDIELATDGAVELTLNDRTILRSPAAEDALTTRVPLTAGRHPIRLTGQWRDGQQALELYWRPPSGERTLVPSSALVPPDR